MKTLRLLAVAAVLIAALQLLPGLRGQQAGTAEHPKVAKLVLRDTIQPMSEEILERALQSAADERDAALVLELNTPGGLLESTRNMVQHMEQSSVPIVIYVSPTGSRAASAGFFLLEAADVAVMAPGTNTGAAHPVLEGQTLDPIMKDKVENDAAAFLRSYAARRGRNVDAAETAIRQSKAFGDQEALNLHLIDFVARDDADLLRQLDGRTVTRFDGSQQTMHLAGAQMVEIRPTVRENILDRLMDPNLALVILLLGALLVYIEFHVPGTVVPGAAGALLILLALFSLNLLPLRYASAALLICGLLLVVGEAKFPSHGLLSLGGTVAAVFGMLTLINAPVPELRVHLATTLAATLTFGAITFVLARMALRARHNKVRTGMSALLGELAEARTPLEPTGQVLVRGELWTAHCPQGARKGDAVVVRGFHELTLEVEPRR